LAPLLIASFISYLTASNILREDAVQSLNSVSRLKSEYINSFFNERAKDLKHISQLTTNIRLFKDIMNEREERKKETGESLADYVDSYTYAVFSIEITLDLENFVTTFQYHDIFLLDLEGNIMVTVKDNYMLGKNILKGEYQDTKFARACNELLATGKPRFSDIETVFDSEGKEATGFLLQLMMDEEDVKDKETGQIKTVDGGLGNRRNLPHR
jgi:methyl-accepting chemotaxis protein